MVGNVFVVRPRKCWEAGDTRRQFGVLSAVSSQRGFKLMDENDVTGVSSDVATRAANKITEKNGVGVINIGGQFQGHYSKCNVVYFEEDCNATVGQKIMTFFEHVQGQLVVNMLTCGQGVLVTYTKTLEDAEIDVINEWGNEINKKLEAKREAEYAEQQKQADAEAAKETETKRLAQLGEVCEANHGAVIKENRKLKGEK